MINDRGIFNTQQHVTMGELFDHMRIVPVKNGLNNCTKEDIMLMNKISAHLGIEAYDNGSVCSSCAEIARMLEACELFLDTDFNIQVENLKDEYHSLSANMVSGPEILDMLIRSCAKYTDAGMSPQQFLINAHKKAIATKKKVKNNGQDRRHKHSTVGELFRNLIFDRGDRCMCETCSKVAIFFMHIDMSLNKDFGIHVKTIHEAYRDIPPYILSYSEITEILLCSAEEYSEDSRLSVRLYWDMTLKSGYVPIAPWLVEQRLSSLN